MYRAYTRPTCQVSSYSAIGPYIFFVFCAKTLKMDIYQNRLYWGFLSNIHNLYFKQI